MVYFVTYIGAENCEITNGRSIGTASHKDSIYPLGAWAVLKLSPERLKAQTEFKAPVKNMASRRPEPEYSLSESNMVNTVGEASLMWTGTCWARDICSRATKSHGINNRNRISCALSHLLRGRGVFCPATEDAMSEGVPRPPDEAQRMVRQKMFWAAITHRPE